MGATIHGASIAQGLVTAGLIEVEAGAAATPLAPAAFFTTLRQAAAAALAPPPPSSSKRKWRRWARVRAFPSRISALVRRISEIEEMTREVQFQQDGAGNSPAGGVNRNRRGRAAVYCGVR
jgi:hypothetical protein